MLGLECSEKLFSLCLAARPIYIATKLESQQCWLSFHREAVQSAGLELWQCLSLDLFAQSPAFLADWRQCGGNGLTPPRALKLLFSPTIILSRTNAQTVKLIPNPLPPFYSSWLLQDSGMRLRTTYKGFTEAVDLYFDHLMSRVVPLQVKARSFLFDLQRSSYWE